ncbi:EAL domain-containing protein [Aquitalea magnusonii]|uniref:EAL domain-containing protein n=1 Tax=Aquitalea magnusonii TaxID=332411 RepID=UPI000750395D
MIELTESAVMRNPLFAARQLAALRALGVAISLDDFGTGFSSFSLLRQLPLDTLKIDRSFITDIAGDDCAAAIVRTIISLARTLRLKTVAEGVETAAQASLLTASRVDLLQGYFFGKPLAAADFLRHAVAVCGNEPT